jgi:tetratricopeptide (TPR) repeat protein
MIAGLFVGAVLCAGAEPQSPKAGAPGMTAARRDALATYGAAVWNLRRERLLTAAKQLEAAAKADPDATEPQKQLARLYAQIGREPQAIRAARKALEKNPADHDTAALLARLLFDAGETTEAVAAAKLAIESKELPEQPAKAVRIYRELAALCERADDLAAAESALRRAVELVYDGRADVVAALAFTPKEADSEAAECLERLGQVLVKRGKFDAAADAFAKAAKLFADPKKVNDPAGAARLAWNLSGALEGKGDHAAALQQLEAFLKLKPRSPEPYRRLADLLRALGRADAIVSKLQDYAEADKLNRPLAAVLAAEMARHAVTRPDADELFAAITGATADPVVMAVVVRSHLDTGRPVEIIKELDRSFAALEKESEEKKPEAPEAAAARKAFAAEKARAVADALEHDPRGVESLLRAAGDDLKAGNKRAHGTYHFLGSLAARHRQLELAVLQFQQAVLGAPESLHVEAYSAYVRALWLANRPAEVEAVCKQAILPGARVNVAPVFFLFHLALALAEQGKENEAIATADRAIEQAPADSRLAVRLRKHLVFRSLRRWDDAIEYGEKLMKEFDAPDERQQLRYAQAAAYSGAKKPAAAEKLLRAILDEDPDHAGACNDLGYHLADQGRDFDQAERLVRHAITVDRIERRKSGSVDSESAAYVDSLGWVLFRRGRLAEARAELEKAARLSEGAGDPTVWDHLGDVLFRLGEKAKAKAAWEQAKKLYGADARLSSRGRRDGRLEEVKRKLTRLP